MKNRLPPWFKQEIPQESALRKMRLVSRFKLNTVCKEASCPNASQCFKNNKMTFLILGNTCTRNCSFCNVAKHITKGLPLDRSEPQRIAELVQLLGLRYVVITSVTRDDLADGGAAQFSETIKLIRALDRRIGIEVLMPDFKGKDLSLQLVLDSVPDVMAHNIETVKRLYRQVRPLADYGFSLNIFKKIKLLNPKMITKSSLMLGLGETEEEVICAMEGLRAGDCDILTLGQYLAPSEEHYPVNEFVRPEQFQSYREIGINMGFKAVYSAPKVRSSYQAEDLFKELTHV